MNNAYKDLLNGVQWVLSNCTSYEVAKELNINNRTVNRYQNGTSTVENMALETAGKLYSYYLTKKGEMEDMEKLQVVYAEWRKISEEMLEDGFSGSLDCGEQAVREDFSNYANLAEVISFDKMLELEEAYEQ